MNPTIIAVTAALALAATLAPKAAVADNDLLPPPPVVTAGQYQRVHIGDCKSRVEHVFHDNGSRAFQGTIYLNRYYVSTDYARIDVAYARSFGCWRVTSKTWTP